MDAEQLQRFEGWVRTHGLTQARAWSASEFQQAPSLAEVDAVEKKLASEALTAERATGNPFRAAATHLSTGLGYAPDPEHDTNAQLRHARGRATGEDGKPGVAATAAEVFQRAQAGKPQK